MAATAAYDSAVYATSSPSSSLTNEGTTASTDRKTYTITDGSKRYLDNGTAAVVQKGNDELQSVTVTGSPTGGTFTLTFGANTTSAIAYNASASAVQSALQALASIGNGNALVTGSNGGPWQVQFTGTLGLADQSNLTADGSGLTGGSSPNVSIAQVQAGAAYATISSGFTLRYVGAKVLFSAAQPVGTHIRFASGKYFTYSAIATARSTEYESELELVDSTVYNTDGAKRYIPTTMSGMITLDTFYVDHTRVKNLQDREKLIGSFVLPSGRRLEGYMFVDKCGIKSEVSDALTEELELQLTDEFYSQN